MGREHRILATLYDPVTWLAERLLLGRLRWELLSQSAATIQLEHAGDERLDALRPHSFDAVVFTLVLCTVNDPLQTLSRARSVLRPEGKLVVLEHVRSNGALGKFQDRVRPVWERIAGGCRLNRDTRSLIARAGFDVSTLRDIRIPGGIVRELVAGSSTKVR
jgi:ubiquinone/menaquinone biosynthesis C-methylase UbiE